MVEIHFAYTKRFSGVLYTLLSSILSACLNFLLKPFNVNMFDVLIIRSFIQGLISIGFIVYKGYQLSSDSNNLLILIRSICAGLAIILFYYCLPLLPLPDLTTLRYTQVVWTAILAVMIFGERLNLPTIIVSLLTMIGVICVAQPTFIFPQTKISNYTSQQTLTIKLNQQSLSILFALVSPVLLALSILLNKILVKKKVPQSLLMFYFLLTKLILLLIIRTYYWLFLKSKQDIFDFQKLFLTKDFIFATIISTLQFIPMILAQIAIKYDHPSILTVVQSSEILFALILQYIFTSIKTNLLALFGSILVIISIFIVGGHKFYSERQNHTCLPMSTQENLLKVDTNK